jgi:hypothetical protein
MLGTTEWLHNLWPLEWYSAPQLVRMSYIIVRGNWFNIIVLNVHAPTEDKTDDVKNSFYVEMEHV